MEKQDELLTRQQQKALHLYFDHLGKTLNELGLDMRKTLKPSIDIPWSKDTVKEYLWRPVQDAQLMKKSTTKLKRKEVTLIWETLNRFLSEKFGITEPFPSIEEIFYAANTTSNKKTTR